jgi:hypothetical protein
LIDTSGAVIPKQTAADVMTRLEFQRSTITSTRFSTINIKMRESAGAGKPTSSPPPSLPHHHRTAAPLMTVMHLGTEKAATEQP